MIIRKRANIDKCDWSQTACRMSHIVEQFKSTSHFHVDTSISLKLAN